MSDEDSLNDMNTTPQRLMPRAATIPEHNRILGLNAIHHGTTLATIKAHHVRANDFDERLDELEKLPDAISKLHGALEANREAMKEYAISNERAMANLGGIVSRLNDEMVTQKQGVDMKKAIVTGFFGLLIAIVGAGGGYLMSHQSAGPKYEPPTHAQQLVIDQKYNDMQPENQRQSPTH